MKKFSIGVMLALTLGVISTAEAQTPSSSTVTQLIEQIRTLQARLQELQNTRGQVRTATSDVQSTLKILRHLRQGMSGDDVKELQELLLAEGVYPEGVISGFYGSLTAKAVRAFQKKHGLDQAGEVGPRTRAILHNLKSRGLLHGTTTGSTTIGVQSGSQVAICHYPPGNPANRHTLTVGSSAVSAHLKHGDTVGACGGSSGTSTPDILAPLISQVSATTTSGTSANVSWTTDESATTLVLYGTSTPVSYGNALAASVGGLSTSHLVSLSSLSASTTYRYLVVSADAAGNTATSSENFFVTP